MKKTEGVVIIGATLIALGVILIMIDVVHQMDPHGAIWNVWMQVEFLFWPLRNTIIGRPIICLGLIVVGVGLLRFSPWARLSAILVTVLLCTIIGIAELFVMPLLALLLWVGPSIFIWRYLDMPDVKQLFTTSHAQRPVLNINPIPQQMAPVIAMPPVMRKLIFYSACIVLAMITFGILQLFEFFERNAIQTCYVTTYLMFVLPCVVLGRLLSPRSTSPAGQYIANRTPAAVIIQAVLLGISLPSICSCIWAYRDKMPGSEAVLVLYVVVAIAAVISIIVGLIRRVPITRSISALVIMFQVMSLIIAIIMICIVIVGVIMTAEGTGAGLPDGLVNAISVVGGLASIFPVSLVLRVLSGPKSDAWFSGRWC